MSDGEQKNEKGLIYRSLASLSWALLLLTRWCRPTWSWSFWREWPAGVKCIAVIWMLLPFPHLYEILKIWLPWIHPLLEEIGIYLPALAQAEQDQRSFDHVRTSMLVVAAWYGVFFLIWRTVLADKQTQAANKQTEINRESHYTELFTKAVGQLGAVRERQGQESEPAIEIRIGAIYSLERLAKDSERDYGPIIETLAAYIREHCRDPKTFDDEGLSGEELKQARQKWIDSLRKTPPADRSDVAAALMVLSRRDKNRRWTSKSDDETQPDFTGANFQGATLWNKNEGLAREDTNLGLAHLEGANLGRVNLSDAKLWGSDLSSLEIWVTNLMGANLEEAYLSGTNLLGANLSGANLLGANLSDTDLGGADLSDADLSNAELSDANFRGANLSGAELWKANLSRANLSGTNLRDAFLAASDLSAALLVGAQLEDSKGLTDEMLGQALGDVNTPLPNGLTRPASWGSREDAIKKWEAFCEEEQRRFRQYLAAVYDD